MICSVLGANPPFEIMQGFIRRIWGTYEIDKILQVRKGVFMVRFQNIHDKITVEKRGIYYFDSKPVVVKGWNPQLDLQFYEVTSHLGSIA